MEKYITDNGYGASKSDAKRGHSDESMKNDKEDDSWISEYEEDEKYRETGFGRDRGDAR